MRRCACTKYCDVSLLGAVFFHIFFFQKVTKIIRKTSKIKKIIIINKSMIFLVDKQNLKREIIILDLEINFKKFF